MKVERDRAVFFHYTLTNLQGDTLEESREDQPLGYIHGTRSIIPGLEREMDGRDAGDQFEVTIEPEQAYGEHDEDLIQTVPSSMFEGVDQVEKGMQFRAQSEQGERLVTVTDVQGDEVTIDANHPLAGETLNFEVEITDVRAATEQELSHGHIHAHGQDH